MYSLIICEERNYKQEGNDSFASITKYYSVYCYGITKQNLNKRSNLMNGIKDQ